MSNVLGLGAITFAILSVPVAAVILICVALLWELVTVWSLGRV